MMDPWWGIAGGWWAEDDMWDGALDSPEDGDQRYEADLVELGVDVAMALGSENEGPEYRGWERVDAIRWRVRG